MEWDMECRPPRPFGWAHLLNLGKGIKDMLATFVPVFLRRDGEDFIEGVLSGKATGSRHRVSGALTSEDNSSQSKMAILETAVKTKRFQKS